ncbi:McrB family protein [Thermanaerothrix daxensis]|uniref:McrB family protein n=1 Tax=Thermanaerothrix daxensis TaxID=869279 RepID=UPI0006C8EE97|nr:AAA family ATPase [Thermanaerothrix daxensis]
MARRLKDQLLYDTFALFKERCLIGDTSLLWPERRIWTLENLRRWKKLVNDRPISTSQTFSEKIEDQLAQAPTALWAITADLLFVYYLPSTSITFSTRINRIRWAAEKAGLSLPAEDDPIWEAHRQLGFCRTAYKYHIRITQLNLLALFAIKVKELSDPNSCLNDPKCVSGLLDEILESIENKGDRAYDMRHAILYLMFPENYERIISTTDKRKIVEHYKRYVTEPTADLDDQLLQIRQQLVKIRPQGPDLDFYDHLRDEWGRGIKESPDDKVVEKAIQLLLRFKNLILAGPPGTGKTYWAKQIAERLVAEQNSVSQVVVGKTATYIYWVTFHQSYAYEDFVEGLRPKLDTNTSNGLSFEIKYGIFRRLCELAEQDSQHRYVLVIDEINRGNIAKVFGELMTLIEADKRGNLSVLLPYSNQPFRVPSNLFLIGTMNTADRSIALLDVALRRRFAFLELMPDAALLDEIVIEEDLNLGTCLRKINQRITETRGADYQIGHSYFLPLKQKSLTREEKIALLDDIWNFQIVPLLKEYFYGQTDLLQQVLPSFFAQDESPVTTVPVLHDDDLIAALSRL